MKAYVVTEGSTSMDGLVAVERDRPEPGPGQVLVRMHAASLNFRDLAVITGNYFGGSVKRDTIPLSDGAGEVVAIGEGVTDFKPGDRVSGTFFQTWEDGQPGPGVAALGAPLDGMLAEYVVLHQDGLVHLPTHLSWEEGATLACAAVTAWHALVVRGGVKPGDTVLLLGTGGVSMFGLQIARMAGAHVIITSSDDAKMERALELGAHAGINYKTKPEWHEEVMKLTGGRGVDHVVEVGGAGTLSRSIQSLAFGGQVALIGVLSGREGDTNPHGLMLKAGRIEGIFVGNRRMFKDLNRALETNQVKPVVDSVFAFDEAPQACAHMAAGKHFGKIVISI